jgi:hypothetical protein
MSTNPYEQLGNRLAVQDALVAMFTATDERDWDAVAAAFADRVALDYTSLSGGEPAVLSGRQIAEAWSATLGGLDATHHLTGNYLIDLDADRATARFAAIATHQLAGGQGDPLWTLGARYHAELHRADGRWLITALTMTAIWGQGNQAILGQGSPQRA